jgi:hypothetical protein
METIETMECLFYLSIFGLFLAILIQFTYKPRKIICYPINEKPDFYRFIGFGMDLSNFYFRRNKDKTYVRYSFIYIFWLPMIPDACYRVKDLYTHFEYKKATHHYAILNKENMNIVEILTIYLGSYSILGILLSLPFVIF